MKIYVVACLKFGGSLCGSMWTPLCQWRRALYVGILFRALENEQNGSREGRDPYEKEGPGPAWPFFLLIDQEFKNVV